MLKVGSEFKKVILVVPSIRERSFKRFCDEWNRVGLFSSCQLILVEDNPTKTFESEHTEFHYSWEDIERELGDKSWIIPRRSDCVRSFGYYMAWKEKADYLLTLDDDCYPEPGYEDLIQKHLEMLEGRSRWFNTLPKVKPRGVPFYNTGSDREVYVNHGLWTNVLDYDAPTQLVSPEQDELPHDNRIVPQHSYFPFCGMNWMCKREAIPLMYHLLMGQKPKRIANGWNNVGDEVKERDTRLVVAKYVNDGVEQPMLDKLPFDRFGDIWCGVLMKKVADRFGWNVSSGVPYVKHDRASNVFSNLKKEANGLEVNETFWQFIDGFDLKREVSAVDAYSTLGTHMAGMGEMYPDYKQYFIDLGNAMQEWARLFKAI